MIVLAGLRVEMPSAACSTQELPRRQFLTAPKGLAAVAKAHTGPAATCYGPWRPSGSCTDPESVRWRLPTLTVAMAATMEATAALAAAVLVPCVERGLGGTCEMQVHRHQPEPPTME